jgi:ABC-type transporter Mla MlaB component
MSASVATLTLQDSRLHLGGVVHFDNAEKVCADGVKLLKQAGKSLVIDMHGLSSSNSLVVAILVSWTRIASSSQQNLHISHMPDKLRAIIRVSGLTTALPESS